MKWLSISIITFIAAVFCWSCNLEKEIEIDLPDYEPKTVVECYLEPGKPFQLLLTRSASYFAPFDTNTSDLLQNLLVNGARVSISHAGKRYDLNNQLVIDQEAQKLYNYFNQELVPQDYSDDFELNIEFQDGSTITGTTRILPVVPLDSIVVEFQEGDTLARVLTYFTDIPDENNYYRRMLHQNSLDSLPMQDFTLDDRVVEDAVVFGTGYEFAVGDTIFNTLFHIDRTYFDFLESVNNAVLSNGNPFGQPSPINSKLEGTARSVGIFTGLSYTRQMTLVKEP
jgi:hypothetical protein